MNIVTVKNVQNVAQETNVEEKENYVVFSQRLAGFLMLKGFRLVRTERNMKFEKKNVFIFKKSDELEEAIDEYKNGTTVIIQPSEDKKIYNV